MFDERPRRKRMRIEDRTYQEGAYFVTVCTFERHPILGSIDGGRSRLSEIGIIVEAEWRELQTRYRGVIIDEYIVMPNHLHGIVALEATSGMTLPKLMREFKSRAVKSLQAHWNDSECRIWQRGYHEATISGADDLARIREYVRANPTSWESDEYRCPSD